MAQGNAYVAQVLWVDCVSYEKSRFVKCFANDVGLCCKARGAGYGANGANTLLRWRLVSHASIFQHVGPFATGACMAMLKVLSEMVGTEELLGLVAFTKFMHVIQVLRSCFPVRGVGKFLTAVPANVCGSGASRRGVESCMNASECCA